MEYGLRAKIGLVLGNNLVTVTASNKSKQTFTDTVIVRYMDNTNPEVKISASSSKPTTKSLVNISGSVIDAEAIISVTWANAATGASGICAGTKSWKAPGIVLKLLETTR